jgi:hypothetical protein
MSESAINLIIVFICLSLIAINILFYYSLQTTMNFVSDKNRQMPGSYVWFNLIPIFGFFWPLIFNASLAKSIENDLKDKGSDEKVNLYPGTIVYPISFLFLTNLTYSSYTTFSSTLNYGTLYLSALFLFSSLYFWFVFWRQIIRFKKIIQGRQVISAPESRYSIVLVAVILAVLFLGGYLYKEYVLDAQQNMDSYDSRSTLFKSNVSDISQQKLADENQTSDLSEQSSNEFKGTKLFKLMDIIKADFNGDGFLDQAFFKKENGTSGIIIKHSNTNEVVRIGFGRSFSSWPDFDCNWVDNWGLIQDNKTYEITFTEDGDILGSRDVRLQNPSIVLGADGAGGGVITFLYGKYVWINQSC